MTKTNNKKTNTVFLASGGTGGHLAPAAALAHTLLKQGYDVHLLTDDRGAQFIDKLGRDIPYSTIKASTIDAGIIGKIRAAFIIGQGYLKSLYLTHKYGPDAIVGFGGYPSFPSVLAAAHMHVPVILHEQNAVLGKANRALSRYAYKIALSFDKVDRLSNNLENKTVITGNPVRNTILNKAQSSYPVLNENSDFSLVIVGGSQGAFVFSHVVPRALANLPESLQSRLDIVQQCRPDDIQAARESYADLCPNIRVRLESFIDDMPETLAKAHLVITRAGASTVAELAVIGRPAIFVPLPGSLEGDQAQNAENIADQGGGWLIPENAFTPDSLSTQLESLMRLPEKLTAAARAIKTLGQPEAAKKLATLVIETAERHS